MSFLSKLLNRWYNFLLVIVPKKFLISFKTDYRKVIKKLWGILDIHVITTSPSLQLISQIFYKSYSEISNVYLGLGYDSGHNDLGL